jgi:hypothetical protein
MSELFDDMLEGFRLLFLGGSGLQPRGQIFFAVLLALFIVVGFAILWVCWRGAINLFRGGNPHDGGD